MRVSVSGSPNCLSSNSFKPAQRVEAAAAHLARHALGIGDVQNRLAFAAALHALIDRRQKAASPHALAAAGIGAAAEQHDEAGQVLVLGAQAVGDPRAHRRAAGPRRAGVQEQLGRRVVELVGVHRRMIASSSATLGDVRQQLGDPRAAGAVLAELVGRAQQLRDAP